MRRDLVLGAAVGAVMVGAITVFARVFADGSWQGPTLVSIALALALAMAIRRLGAGPVTSTIASLVGFITFSYITHVETEGLFPGTASFAAYRDLLVEGVRAFREAEAPTEVLPGLLVIVTGAAWWVTFAAHELLVRFRRPGLSLLPPAVLWAVPLAVPLPPGRTWPQALPFLAGAALVLLLEPDADVVGWSRDRPAQRLTSAGMAVGGVALAVAAMAPAMLPGYQEPPWYDVGAGTDPRGYQPIVDVGDRLQLPEPRDVLEVRSDRRMYYRLAALDSFDGTTWRLGPSGSTSFRPNDEQLYRADADLPPEVPIQRAVEARAQIRVLDLENIFAPVPYQPLRVTGPARGQMVYSTDGGFVASAELTDNELAGRLVTGIVEGFEYGVISALPQPDPDDVRDLVIDPGALAEHLQLPAAYEQLGVLAEQIYVERGAATPIEKAFALQNYFIEDGSPFTYTTDVEPLRGSGALERFVLEDRTGYCEYYATAMAVMLRATGVPARVAVGFLSGTDVTADIEEDIVDPGSGRPIRTYVISTDDAHAWVEVLAPGYGWLKFDPTPRSDGLVQPPTEENLDPLLTIAERTSLGGDAPELGEQPDPREDLAGPEPLGPDGRPLDAPLGPGDGAEAGRIDAPLVLLMLIGVGLAAIAVRRYRERLHRPDLDLPDRVLAAQRRVYSSAARVGVGRRPHETARDVARRWSDDGRTDSAAAGRFAELAQAAAFGGELGADAGEESERLGHDLVAELTRSVPTSTRLASPVRLPAERIAGAGRQVVRRARHRGAR
ncbi:MAG: DUF3488 and transglutaminase-like domain-containing protein [Actinobacteria bacterium]|nr:DUF3488 and transglutaminase-like domain-containing protein [Actinomycetota bacterium]